MDWTAIYVLASGALSALILGIWKPWGAAYAGEKGKNLARKEDLAEILFEVRAVTIAQKQIESKLSGDLWNRQTRWNQKRDIYGSIIHALQDFTNVLALMPTILQLRDEAEFEEIKLDMAAKLNDQLGKISVAQGELASAHALALIFANEKCKEALLQYFETTNTNDLETITAEWAIAEKDKAIFLLHEVIEAAKLDLETDG